MSELATRSAAAIVLVALALVAAFVGGNLLAGLVAVAACVMFYEWRRMVRGWGSVWQIAGFVYALLPALALLWIRERFTVNGNPAGFELLLWVFIVTWSVDIGAYFAGRTFGGPKLAPSISPNKTWAGLAGGVLAAAIGGAICANAVALPKATTWLAPLFAVAAQGGDLFESWLKRRAGVKDSGTWLPGHGGALDRLDGLVVVASLAALTFLGGML